MFLTFIYLFFYFLVCYKPILAEIKACTDKQNYDKIVLLGGTTDDSMLMSDPLAFFVSHLCNLICWYSHSPESHYYLHAMPQSLKDEMDLFSLVDVQPISPLSNSYLFFSFR
jgi:hypothetical protein